MQLKIKNIGPIKETTIDLTKRLLIFTGYNNTGKTYLSYLVFLISRGSFFSGYDLDILKKDIGKVIQEGKVSIDLETILENQYENLFSIINGELKKRMPNFFGNKSSFSDSEIDVRWNSKSEYLQWVKKMPIGWMLSLSNSRITVSKKSNDFTLNVNYDVFNDPKKIVETDFEYIARVFQNIVLNSLVEYLPKNGTQFLAAERIGIAMFSKDISLNKAKAFDELTTVDGQKFKDAISENFNNYPTPIKEAIIAQEEFKDYKKQKGVCWDIAEEIEQKILGSVISITNDNEIEVSIANNKSITLSLSGSSIKSLSALTFFLKHRATKGNVIIMDEPEINLHPNNQIALARILVKIVNQGIKVIISTHSDYMIRELSNLLMLGLNKNEATYTLIERYGYDNSELIDPNEISAYFMERNSEGVTEISNISLHQGEIPVKSFLEIINKQNLISDDIYFTLNAQNDTDS